LIIAGPEPIHGFLNWILEIKVNDAPQVAEHLGITARAYAFWERDPVALKAEQLAALAKLFDVSVDYLVGQEPPRERKGGPMGRVRRVFEQVSRLPRSQQQYILKVVEDLVGSAVGKRSGSNRDS
jgi:transcriptional regulator with XRE-family HTH domain